MKKSIYDLVAILISSPFENINYSNKDVETLIRIGITNSKELFLRKEE